MPRLIDDVRAEGVKLPAHVIHPIKEPKWRAHRDRLMSFMADTSIPVIVADNVAAYYFEGTAQENWNIRRDFPNLAPPFETFWIEHRMPHKIRSEDGDTDLSHLNIRVGLFVFGSPRENITGENLPDEMRWLLNFELFIDYGVRGYGIRGPHGSIQMAIDAGGALIGTPQMVHFSDASETTAEVLRKFIGWTHPALLTISFLHCKNVIVTDNEVPKPLAKKYEARTGVKPTAYKTLVIEPLKQILRSQGRADSVGLAKAMHICRGHFKDYRQGKGLFGKYHQLVWHPSVVRGTGAADEKPERTIEVKV